MDLECELIKLSPGSTLTTTNGGEGCPVGPPATLPLQPPSDAFPPIETLTNNFRILYSGSITAAMLADTTKKRWLLQMHDQVGCTAFDPNSWLPTKNARLFTAFACSSWSQSKQQQEFWLQFGCSLSWWHCIGCSSSQLNWIVALLLVAVCSHTCTYCGFWLQFVVTVTTP